jgi:anti-anti-sigma regulatory factor
MRAATVDLLPVSLPTFSINHQANEQQIIVYLRGNADSDVADTFALYLQQLHDIAIASKVREVVFDSRELYFLTSACIKSLVVAIKRLMAEEARLQYKIRLVTTPALRWQERSFEVLTKIAPLLVSVSPD